MGRRGRCHVWDHLCTLSHTWYSLFLSQYDFMERLDGKEKWSVVESPRERRSIQTLVQNEAVFVQYLDVGLWHLAFYNDGKDKEMVSFNTVVLGRCGISEMVHHEGKMEMFWASL